MQTVVCSWLCHCNNYLWYLKLATRQLWRTMSSEMWRRVDWYKSTYSSATLAVCISIKYENAKAAVPLSRWYTHVPARSGTPHLTCPGGLALPLISRKLHLSVSQCSPLYEVLCDFFYGPNVLLDGADLQDGFLHFGAEQSPCFAVSAKFTFMLIR